MGDKERDISFDENCPNCNSKNIIREAEDEYADKEDSVSSDAYECQDCRHIWRGEVSYG